MCFSYTNFWENSLLILSQMPFRVPMLHPSTTCSITHSLIFRSEMPVSHLYLYSLITHVASILNNCFHMGLSQEIIRIRWVTFIMSLHVPGSGIIVLHILFHGIFPKWLWADVTNSILKMRKWQFQMLSSWKVSKVKSLSSSACSASMA